MKKNGNNTDTTVWYRQFWPWFIFGLPAVVVVASLVTVYIAVSHQDPVIDEEYYQHGMKINERLKTPGDASSGNVSPDNALPAKVNRPLPAHQTP
jgi:hypothetical protein